MLFRSVFVILKFMTIAVKKEAHANAQFARNHFHLSTS